MGPLLMPSKLVMLMPLKPLNAMMLPSPAFTPPMVHEVGPQAGPAKPVSMPQLPLPSGIVPVMSVPILLPWMTTPVGL